VVGEAIAGRRHEVFLVTKVYPHNATLPGAVEACNRSLRRLGTDHLELYLLHWRGAVPLSETLAAFMLLQESGKILDYGVSNFDVSDMEEAFRQPGGRRIATDQVLYNLRRRGVEYDLLPWCRAHGLPVMAYSPLEHSARDQRALLDNPTLRGIAARHGATPSQVGLARVLRQPDIVAIPKAVSREHIRENREALDLHLTDDDLAALDRAFPPPRRKVPLAVR
jgi:diketogulonate reductase-like aldo/keto reductase